MTSTFSCNNIHFSKKKVCTTPLFETDRLSEIKKAHAYLKQEIIFLKRRRASLKEEMKLK